MSDLKDEIAQELANRFSDNPYYLDNAAQAIIDLIIARIPPLVWDRVRCDESKIHPTDWLWEWKAGKYTIQEYDEGDVWLCYDDVEVEIFSDDDVIKAAKAAANAHHVAQLCKGMGIE